MEDARQYPKNNPCSKRPGSTGGPAAYTLILLRHGESRWNRENRFTGWTDIDLTPAGISEAHRAAGLIRDNHLVFATAFTSVLKRAVRTLWIVMDELDLMYVPVRNSWRLNERHYGALQGMDKNEAVQHYGAAQVAAWRRGYAVRPPALSADDPRHPRFDPRYAALDGCELPAAESLADTLDRVLPYWNETIRPALIRDTCVLVAAHGNSIRALAKHLDTISDEAITGLEIPTGYPLVYEFDALVNPVRHYFLGSAEEIEKATRHTREQASSRAGQNNTREETL
jgi:2,3-bisphosphoglycerate-dependent phosphoglycerate mutase